MSDADAGLIYRWMMPIAAVCALIAGVALSLREAGISRDVFLLILSSAGVAVSALLISMIVQNRERVARAIAPPADSAQLLVQDIIAGVFFTKLDFRVRYDADLEKIRKIIKKINKEIMQDESIKRVMLSDVKSVGVREMGDSAMIMRVKFKTAPGEQFSNRREVFHRVQKAFWESGIEFACLTPRTLASLNPHFSILITTRVMSSW